MEETVELDPEGFESTLQDEQGIGDQDEPLLIDVPEVPVIGDQPMKHTGCFKCLRWSICCETVFRDVRE